MPSSRQRSARWGVASVALALLPGVACAVWYAAAAHAASGVSGFPLDDSWIHAQFARNLATGHGFTYTGGQWVSGSTAPGWTVLLAAGYFLTRNIVAAAFALGVAAQLAAGYYAIRLARLLGASHGVSLAAGTATVVLPVMTWGAVSGMEVPLAAALVLAGVYHHAAERDAAGPRRYLGAALLGVSALARPESLAVAAIVLASELAAKDDPRRRMLRFGLGLLTCAALFAPLVVFSYATIGRPLPTTFYAKSGPGIVRAIETGDTVMAHRNLTVHGPLAARNFALILQDQLSWGAWLLLPAALVLAASAATRGLALTLVAVLLVVPYAMGLTAPQRLKPDNVRYAAQLVVLVPPLVVAGVSRLVRFRPAVAVIVIAMIGLTGWRTLEATPLYARAVKNIEELHVATGKWLAANRPENELVAVNDVGAIAYFSHRRILDLEGLVSPEVLPYRVFADRGLRVVTAMHPDVIVIFPDWYPDISKSSEFREVHRISISDNLVSAGDTMVVYEPAVAAVTAR